MGLVGYQVEKENNENQKKLRQLQELAKQAAQKKAEKRRNHLSLPMRGRQLYIGDKQQEQIMRCELFRQANEAETRDLGTQKAGFLAHVQQLEKQLKKLNK